MLKHQEHFVVDSSLLQELFERLIGRPAIALGELVKNLYEADAPTCRLEFSEDQIVISDSGDGMSERDFLAFWMRLGTTHKIDEGRSPGGRPLSGSKGIGRLSVQFLADEMILESTSKTTPDESLYAIVDWKSVVRGQDLSTVNVEWEPRPEHPEYPAGSQSGTRITLKGLKTKWDADAIGQLGDEVWMFRSPFKRTRKRTDDRRPEDFDIEIDAPEIEGARAAFDDKFEAVFSNWKARIIGNLEDGRSGGKASISLEFRKGYPEHSGKIERFHETVDLPVRGDGKKKPLEPLVDRASFEILVYKPEGAQRGGISVGDLREYLSKFGNVSVYDSSFRLPYYGFGRDAAGQDWLSIALDQGRRLNASELLPERLRTQNKYMQDLPAPGRILGAVEIDTNHERTAAEKVNAAPGSWLQIQPGRDRLHDNLAFPQLRNLIRFSLDFYANRYRLLALRADEKGRDQEPASKKYERAMAVIERNRSEIPASVVREVKRELTDAHKSRLEEEDALDRRAALLAPLASAGMAAMSMNHEIARETAFLARAGRRLRRIAKDNSIPELSIIADEFDEARHRLESLQDLFAPLLSDTDIEASERLGVHAVVKQVVGAMGVLMPRVEFDLSGIPANMRFPLGSLAEWNAILQNVLANAWNAMLDSKKAKVMFRAGRDTRKEWLRISDTGQGLTIPVPEAPQLFEPFERRLGISEDKRSIAIGGQGLGLAIVRMIAHRRAAKVRFVLPEEGFSTTFELSWTGVKQ